MLQVVYHMMQVCHMTGALRRFVGPIFCPFHVSSKMSDDFPRSKSTFARNFFTDTSNFIDNHLNAVRFVSYGVAAIGCVVILKTTHAFRIFYTVKDIPADYLRKGVKLQGQVTKVTSVGSLQIRHIPIFRLPWRKECQDHSLHITLGGVEVLPPGVNWLEQNLANKQIWFDMLKVDCFENQESLCCIVTTKKNFMRSFYVNEEIISLGLAKVQHIDGLSTKKYLKFSERLLKAEIKADKKGRGIWQRPSLMDKIRSFPSKVLSSLKEKISLPFKEKENDKDKS